MTDGPQPVDNVEEWNSLLLKNIDKIIVCDFYATWCPPCRTAAPFYHEMAAEADFSSIIFVKCNVDKASGVAQVACLALQMNVIAFLSVIFVFC